MVRFGNLFLAQSAVKAMATLTPYQTEHINRFGNYTVNFSRTPEPLPLNLHQSEGHPWIDPIGLVAPV